MKPCRLPGKICRHSMHGVRGRFLAVLHGPPKVAMHKVLEKRAAWWPLKCGPAMQRCFAGAAHVAAQRGKAREVQRG